MTLAQLADALNQLNQQWVQGQISDKEYGNMAAKVISHCGWLNQNPTE
jgi:hypothetical protein